MFYLDDWKPQIDDKQDFIQDLTYEENLNKFKQLSENIYKLITEETSHDKGNMEKNTTLQKEAILGEEFAVKIYKDKIADKLRQLKAASHWYPAWYKDLISAIYHEAWGLAGLAEFFDEKYKNSSSAKVIGENIYFLINGKQTLMPQKIELQRREQLVKTLCSDNNGKALFNSDSHEVYMRDGSRVKIYNSAISMKNQDSIVIRRYILPEYTFEAQLERETISEEMIPLFKEMVNLGYNILFTGAVRTAKTTFLQTFLKYEDPTLEGMLIQTDPEVNISNILPNAPVISLIADTDERMNGIVKEILRSDMDWLAYAEARDGASLLTAIRVAKKGTRRIKLTFHTRNPENICEDIATEIVSYAPAMDLKSVEKMVAGTFDYIFHFIQCKDKSKKKLKSISELSYNKEDGKIKVIPICEYDVLNDTWQWNNYIGKEIETAGKEEDIESYMRFKQILEELSKKYPMQHLQGKEYSI